MENESYEKQAEKPENHRGCLGRLFRFGAGAFLLLVISLIWLNGPGFRWLGPKVAGYYLSKAGIEGEMSFGGNLVGGVEIYDVNLRSEGALERLVIGRIETDYLLSEIVRGKLRGIEVKGVRLDLRIDAEKEEESEDMDFAKLGKMMRDVRGRILPVEIGLEVLAVSVRKGDDLFLEIEESSLSHRSGSGEIELELGEIRDFEGRTLAAQDTVIDWDESKLRVEALELLPILGLKDIEISLPDSGEISVLGKVRLGDGVLNLDVGKDLADLRLDLVEGVLDVAEIGNGFGVDLPIKGRVTSVALELREFYPEWKLGEGSAELYVEGFESGEWLVPELAIGVELLGDEIVAKVAGRSRGTLFSADGRADFSWADDGKFSLSDMGGGLTIEQVDALLVEYEFLDFPKSKLGGTWEADLDGKFSADLSLEAKDVEVSPIRLKAAYEDGVVDVSDLQTEGLSVRGKYHVEKKSYEGKVVAESFRSDGIDAWLIGLGVVLPGSGQLQMVWEGGGNLEDKTHRGKVEDFSIDWDWKEEGREPISASGGFDYVWPKELVVSDMVVRTAGQRLVMNAELKDGFLELGELLWFDGEKKLAHGVGKIPMPTDFAKLEDLLDNGAEGLDLNVESEVLPLAILRPWLGGLEIMNEEATGKVSIKVSGSVALPEIVADLELKNLQVVDRPELPQSDMTVNFVAKEGVAQFSADLVAKDYAPAVMKAKMAFRPRLWISDPNVLMNEVIEGTIDLPRLELTRFQALIPQVEKLAGVVEGKVVIGGTVGEPKVDGMLDLSAGSIKLNTNSIPEIREVALKVKADLDKVTIEGNAGDLAGGTLKINGVLGLRNETGTGLGLVDITLEGRGLPIVRNDHLILRANADIKVKGALDSAVLTGEVGIIDSLFFRDIELIPIGRPFLGPAPAELPALDVPDDVGRYVPEAFQNWMMDVVVKTVDPVLIRGNLGEGEVDGNVRINGKMGDPKPNGTVSLHNAVVRLPFSKLEVSNGTLRFSPQTGFDPIVELRGSAEPRPYRVQVYAHGRASDPQLILTSQPPLPENEIMTLLATGTTASGLEDSQAAAMRASQLLIEELRRGRFLFGDKLKPILGLLDDVDFTLSDNDPYDSDTYNSATLKVSSRWYISAGLGAEGEQRVMAIYRLRFR